jgi:DNA-directed RNA polymerase specialized sigma24 family protein
MKLREIADAMQCSEGTVKKHLFTATQRMRKRLKNVFE